MKKRGFGKGRWNGAGGKPEGKETIIQAATREREEEILVTPHNLTLSAKLNFHFPETKSDWDQQVHVFTTTEWAGIPTGTARVV